MIIRTREAVIGTAGVALLGLLIGAVPSAQVAPQSEASGLIAGTVKDPGGAPFKGAFVRARSVARPTITTSVMSDTQGQYKIENLSPGGYDVWATAVGYGSDQPQKVTVTGGGSLSQNLALQKGSVKWSDLNQYQASKLLPEGEGKQILLGVQCFICHGFQTRIAATRRNEANWTRAVTFMRKAMHARFGNGFSDQRAAVLISYLNSTFGLDSPLPQSPEALPEYKATVRSFSDDSTRIVYVEYALPGPNRLPFSAAPDKDGYLWIPYYGTLNRIGRLDPRTGTVQEFSVPHEGGAAGVHSAVPAQDGTVWIAEQLTNKLGKWDPRTQKITEYQDAYLPGKEGIQAGGSKHTARIDQQGNVWSTGNPLTRFNPRTEKFTRFSEVPFAYDVAIDAEGNAWFANGTGGAGDAIGKVDAKTDKITTWAPPTPRSLPRRLQIDPQGIVWFTESNAGKIGRFDPKTQAFKEFQLPGPSPSPYGIGIDKDNYIWYNSDYLDTLGRLDPRTGQVTEYPFPYSENMIKEFFLDSQGRLWFGSTANNIVGYVTVKTGR